MQVLRSFHSKGVLPPSLQVLEVLARLQVVLHLFILMIRGDKGLSKHRGRVNKLLGEAILLRDLLDLVWRNARLCHLTKA